MIVEHPAVVLTEDGLPLQALAAIPPSPRGGLVACHPHPLHGGDMHNPVVVRAVEVAGEVGLATVRFNFRGVGDSGGRHGGGHAERADVRAAVGHLVALGVPAPRLVAGYSFGAAVAAAVAPAEPRLGGLALIAPPLAVTGESAYDGLAGWRAPVLIVAASDDAWAPLDALERLARRLPAARLAVVEGADHFFLGRLHPLGERLRAWLETLAG